MEPGEMIFMEGFVLQDAMSAFEAGGIYFVLSMTPYLPDRLANRAWTLASQFQNKIAKNSTHLR